MATIYGTNGADILRATQAADAIYGLLGDDSIDGVQGRDFIYGGNGNDTLDGGGGQDVIDGEGGFDLLLYSTYTTAVWADLRSGVVSFPDDVWPGETVLGVEAVDGGLRNDRLVGNGAGNVLRGNNGNDVLIGNVGSDTLTGGAGADSLDGGNGQDVLVGGLGDDTMYGGLHDDTFAFGPIAVLDDADNRQLVETGKEVIDGGTGTDTVYVEAPAHEISSDDAEYSILTGSLPVRANLGAGTLRLGDSPNRSTLISIESIETGSGDDSINGSTGDNFIRTGDGANVVYAGNGNDTIVGGTYTYNGQSNGTGDMLNGGAGDDLIISGGASDFWIEEGIQYEEYGRDVLNGADGDDTLVGGSGSLDFTGGAGRDHFVVTDEVIVHLFSGYIWRADPMITDFSNEDTIEFRIMDGDQATLRFVGEAQYIQTGQVSYYRSGDDTVIHAAFPNLDGQPNHVRLVLEDYAGPVSADIFDL